VITQVARRGIGALAAFLCVASMACEKDAASTDTAVAVAGSAAETTPGATGSANAAPRRGNAQPGRVEAKDFDLDGAAALIRDNDVKDGKALEQALNQSARHRVDTDGDGRRDPLQVVETRDGDQRSFQIRAIPSTRARRPPDTVAVPIATIAFVAVGPTVRVTMRYAEPVVVVQPPVIAFEVPLVVGTFAHWVLIVDRPIFIGVVVVIETRHHKHKHKHKKGRW